jgi:hydroxysqualene dehydroxylase
LGTDGLIRYQKRFTIELMEPGGRKIRLRSLPLPSPFHLAAGVLTSSGLSWTDRYHLLRAGAIIGGTTTLPPLVTVRDWLDGLGQPDRLRRRWWYPLATAALNEVPEKASAGLFLNVLRLTFFGKAADSAFGIMTVSLGNLYTDQAKKVIEANNGRVLLNSAVVRIHFSGTKAEGVDLRDGSRLMADDTISAVPPRSLEQIFPPELAAKDSSFSSLGRFHDSPILSFHLWFDRPVMEEEFVGLVDSPIHWVFNKARLWQEGKSASGAVAAVVSGAHDLINRPREELMALCLKELKRYLPRAENASLLHGRLIKERGATYSCTAAAEALRPDQKTAFGNFFLAGDWTKTGLPATIEGAVKSGHRCAELITRS